MEKIMRKAYYIFTIHTKNKTGIDKLVSFEDSYTDIGEARAYKRASGYHCDENQYAKLYFVKPEDIRNPENYG